MRTDSITEYSVVVPVEVRITRHDDGTTTVQWIDIDDDTRTIAYDAEEWERVSPMQAGPLLEAGEAAVNNAIAPFRRV